MVAVSTLLHSAVICTAIAGCTSVSAHPDDRLEIDVSSGAFITSTGHSGTELVRVEWDKTPTRADVEKLWTPEMYQVSVATLSCGLSEQGTLKDCALTNSDPAGPPTEALYRRLADLFRAAPEFVGEYGSRIKNILVSIRVLNSSGQKSLKPVCAPPFCVTVPLPPSPPDKPSQN